MLSTLLDERVDLLSTIAAGPRQRSYFGSESRGTRDHILLSQIRDSHNLEVQIPLLIFPGTQLPSYTPRQWVPFPSPPSTRKATLEVFEPASTRGPRFPTARASLYSLVADNTENTASEKYSVVEKWLPRRCLAMTASSFATIPAFSRHVTILKASITLPPCLLNFFMADRKRVNNFTLNLFHVEYSQSVNVWSGS
jgi:hypothetical protein